MINLQVVDKSHSGPYGRMSLYGKLSISDNYKMISSDNGLRIFDRDQKVLHQFDKEGCYIGSVKENEEDADNAT